MASNQTYLALVNAAIRESGADLNALTSSTFPTTTDTLQTRMIQWVNQAYREIQMERNWTFMSKRASIIVKPRMYVEQNSTSTATIRYNDRLSCNDSSATMRVTAITLISGAWASGTAKAYIDYESLSGNYKLNENVDRLGYQTLSGISVTAGGSGYTSAPTISFTGGAGSGAAATAIIDTDTLSATYGQVTDVTITNYGTGYTSAPTVVFSSGSAAATATVGAADVFKIKGFGRYNLSTIVTDLLEPNFDSFFIQSTGGSTTQTNFAGTDLLPLNNIAWDEFVKTGEWWNGGVTKPELFTMAPDGTIVLFPFPDQEYVLHFTYDATPTDLSVYGDTISNIPADYQDMVVWRAVMYYADWDTKTTVFMRASKRYTYYKKRLEVRCLPRMTFAPSKYHC